VDVLAIGCWQILCERQRLKLPSTSSDAHTCSSHLNDRNLVLVTRGALPGFVTRQRRFKHVEAAIKHVAQRIDTKLSFEDAAPR